MALKSVKDELKKYIGDYMSLILAFASIYIAGKVVKEVGKDITKIQARKEVVEASKNNSFDVISQFESILKICEVKRKSHGSSNVKVLPFTPSNRCLEYIRSHHLTCKADEQRFITHYRKVLSKEIAKRQEDYDKHYFKVKEEVDILKNSGDYEIARFEHINVFVNYESVKNKVNDICKTFLGDFLINDVKIEQTNPQSFKEIWALKIPVTMKFKLEDFYMACAERCGYIY